MKVTTTHNSDTEAALHVAADEKQLAEVKKHVLKELGPQVKVPGFRAGKVPANLIEKNIDQSVLQTQFLEHAINDLYPEAVAEAGIRPVDRPEISVKKFVPFTTLEFEAVVPVVSNVKLADYKKVKMARPIIKITDKDIDEVIDALRKRQAEKKDVDRAAKTGDQVTIDFKGVDEKGEPVKGADGKDYPLALGSNTFIPGFEDKLVGLKAGEEVNFTLTFPKDYGVKALASRKVTFSVKVTKVQEVVEPNLDDAFASSVGPVKTVKELKDDIKRELLVERQRQSDLDYESNLVKEITAKSKLSIPKVLIDQQVERMFQELQQNLVYRGQTIQEFLNFEGKTEDEYRQGELAEKAEERVKASIVLSEIAEKENLEVMPEELEIRIQTLKGQYQDPKMQEELNKPENRRDIAARMLSEKTVAILASSASK